MHKLANLLDSLRCEFRNFSPDSSNIEQIHFHTYLQYAKAFVIISYMTCFLQKKKSLHSPTKFFKHNTSVELHFWNIKSLNKYPQLPQKILNSRISKNFPRKNRQRRRGGVATEQKTPTFHLPDELPRSRRLRK